MAKLPITVSVAQSENADGSVTASLTLTDANGVKFAADAVTLNPQSTALETLGVLRECIRGHLSTYLGFADLPSSFSVTIGLDTTMRELDLL